MLKVQVSLRWLQLVGILLIPACLGGNPPKPFNSEVIPKEAIAEITEIPDRPVLIRFLNSKTDSIATIGRTIKLGESIRTEGNALAQITLKSGTIVRMEGDTILTINDDSRIQLGKGKIVVWVPARPNAAVKVMLTGAIASIKNATTYIDSTINSSKAQQVVSLEGTTEVLLVDTSKPILVQAGQNLAIDKDGNRDGANIQPKALSQKELKAEFSKTKLLSGFNSQIGSQEAIAFNLKIPISPTESVIPSRRPAKIKPANSPEPVYKAEPYAYERRAEPVRSRGRDYEPPTKSSTPGGFDPTAPRVTSDFIPMDEPPQPVQPEESIP
jgi:hypothetical protein